MIVTAKIYLTQDATDNHCEIISQGVSTLTNVPSSINLKRFDDNKHIVWVQFSMRNSPADEVAPEIEQLLTKDLPDLKNVNLRISR